MAVVDVAKQPCSVLRGVGPKLAEKLARCGIHTISDLLFHLPMRYQDRTRLTPISALRHGMYGVFEGDVTHIESGKGRRKSLVCTVSDNTGNVHIRFFHYADGHGKKIQVGTRLRCMGEARRLGFQLEIVHPEYFVLDDNNEIPIDETLTAIYPSTEGLHQKALRKLVAQAMVLLNNDKLLEDLIPAQIREDMKLSSLRNALIYVHNPPSNADLNQLLEGIHPHQQRLAFEEMLAHQLSLQRVRIQVQSHKAPAFNSDNKLSQAFLEQLPFALTNAQARVSDEIATDLAQAVPALRLVQGDVGSGKTVVAALAALKAIECGYQAVLMAPTEILAEQHYHNFTKWFEPLGLKLGWLSGKVKGAARKQALDDLASGAAEFIVGTHALFQADINFNKLGLVIVDEQHRFGVDQRLALRDKGVQQGLHPHQIIMTATPIPRTLAMSVYSDLDHSIIDELPPGRTPVKTVVIPSTRRMDVISRIKTACEAGRQVYWVCTLIEESDELQCQAAEETAKVLAENLPGIQVDLIHGRMKPQEKEKKMQAFSSGQSQVLVATTVIEVGVDVPNASLMIIENAERLGLSQLHQLRGRVGRGSAESHCVLLYQDPLSKLAKERLSIMRTSNDGFVIAERDLEIRGPGEVLGTRQAGLVQMRIADLSRDSDLLPQVQQAARLIVDHNPAVIELLVERWLGSAEQYAAV